MKAFIAILVAMTTAASFGHDTVTHQTLMDSAMSKAAELNPPLSFAGTPYTRMHEGTADEDNGTRSLDHAYNPMTGGVFPLGSMTARDTAADRWASMVSAFLAGNFDGGDGSGAWHYLGRAAHLVQDMTSPLHVFALQHAAPTCQFEAYWRDNDAYLRTLLAGIGAPLDSNTLDTKSTERLDAFTSARLQYRFSNSCTNKDNSDVRGFSEVVAWTTYFRSTFWGQIVFVDDGSSGIATAPMTTGTTFIDGYVGPQTNTLHAMFPNDVRWIATWYDDYYEITDKNGYVFRWMSWTETDDFSSCGTTDLAAGGWAAGYQDSSKLVVGSANDGSGARTTGRFFFDLRELGKSTAGNANRYCYPNNYPDGTAMSGHLHEYFGAYLDPLLVRYNAGLLGLANRRVAIKTLDVVAADNFTWSRRDNFGNGPAFSAGTSGSNFYFVAKSEVTLTAPATNQAGCAFHHWLKDGALFTDNTNCTLVLNTAATPIPAGGVIYTADFNADLDNDRMPDWWEQQYFGGHADPDADADGDGLSNRSEYLAGTVPTNSASSFVFAAVSGPAITWSTVPGKTYKVLYADTPAGPWLEDLPNAQVTAGAGQSQLSYSDTTASGVERRYYRIRLALP
jgi:hypothetical protein